VNVTLLFSAAQHIAAAEEPQSVVSLYVEILAAPLTANTMREATLKALADHGKIDGSFYVRPAREMKKWSSPPRPASTLPRPLLNCWMKARLHSWRPKKDLACIESRSRRLKAA
jgi:transaldolase